MWEVNENQTETILNLHIKTGKGSDSGSWLVKGLNLFSSCFIMKCIVVFFTAIEGVHMQDKALSDF